MKNSLSIKKILAAFILLAGVLFSFAAFAAAPQIVLFCSSWNNKCRDARLACTYTAEYLGINFIDLDIDQPSSQQKAANLGVNLPSSIPYIYVFDSNGHLVKEKIYKDEAPEALEKEIGYKLYPVPH
jgi:hypothetical protein